MKGISKIVLFLLLLITAFSISRPYIVEAAGKFSSGSTIANVEVEGLTLQEAKIKLQEEIAAWVGSGNVLAESGQEQIEIPKSIITFHIDDTLQQLEEKTKRHWKNFFLKEKNVHLPLEVEIEELPQDLPITIDKDQLKEDLKDVASELRNDKISLIIDESVQVEKEKLAEVSLTIPNISSTVNKYIVEQFIGYEIPANSLYSFLDHITLLDGMANSEEEMSFVATALYTLILHTNMEIIERHSQGEIPSYSDAGIEAEVNRKENKDLQIYNPNEFPYTIDAKIVENQLTMTISSVSTTTSYEYKHENSTEIKSRTIYRYDPKLSPGQKEVIQHGKNGLQVEVYRSVKGEEKEKELISRDYYPPTPKIVAVSTKEQDDLTQDANTSPSFDLDFLLGEENPEENNLDEEISDGPNSFQEIEKIFGQGNGTEEDKEELESLFSACLVQALEEDKDSETEEEFDICDFLWLLVFLGSLSEENSNSTDPMLEDIGNLPELFRETEEPTEEVK